MTTVFNSLPIFDCEPCAPDYDCSDGHFMRVYRGVSKDEFDSYCQKIEEAGFVCYAQNSIGNNHAVTYISTVTAYLYLSECDSTMRIIAAESAELLPVAVPEYERSCQTEFYMHETDHTLIDCGMCLITKCADGSFFVVDSAHYYQFNDNDRIYKFMRDRTPEGKKVVVSGWFISHGHTDHISKFYDFLKYNLDDVEIECIYINLISDEYKSEKWSKEEISMARKLRDGIAESGIKCVKLHTGQHFSVRNLEFDVLCTHEDIYPQQCSDYNDSSTVLMMTAEGSRVFIPGDASALASIVMEERYGELLKCDIMQVAHHGHFGTSDRFYELAGASVALFATTQIKYDEEFPKQSPNRTAVKIAKEYYISSNGTVKIPLPYKPGNIECLPDETFEDFDKIYGLWGYEYTDERKQELLDLFIKNGGNVEKLYLPAL